MTTIVLLMASLVPLIVAPLVARRTGRAPHVVAALDSFVAVTVGGVTVVHLLPHAVHELGRMAIAVAALGFLVPVILHYGMHRLEQRALPALVALVLAGLAIHAIGDGVALVSAGRDGDAARNVYLAAAVLLHRLPVALAIWWFARPTLGRGVAMGLLVTIGAGTLVGSLIAGDLIPAWSMAAVGWTESFVGGMLFHVLIGHHRPRTTDADAGRVRAGFLFGLGLGALFLVATVARFGAPSVVGHHPDAFDAAAVLVVIVYVLASRLRAPARRSPASGRIGDEP